MDAWQPIDDKVAFPGSVSQHRRQRNANRNERVEERRRIVLEDKGMKVKNDATGSATMDLIVVATVHLPRKTDEEETEKEVSAHKRGPLNDYY